MQSRQASSVLYIVSAAILAAVRGNSVEEGGNIVTLVASRSKQTEVDK